MNASQKRAITEHRRRLREQGLVRYEVRGSPKDKELIRKFAKRLAANDAAANRLRTEIARQVDASRRGGIVEALLNSPFAGADLQTQREVTTGRDIDL